MIDVDATAVEEKRLQSNPRGKKKGEKFRCAADLSCKVPASQQSRQQAASPGHTGQEAEDRSQLANHMSRRSGYPQ